ncbi:lectin-like domain-containing protein [Companilactobacillus ginsenosidimutans]|uniref:Cell surface protein n=1 Tax=Companilactobacillus ginsenosidimutans TaxID=1007676 RepID=A0A0H4QNG7_9LACO|nr:hypothetical protein [Companilactobacillus ginsenosidimutans]AKP68308.1 hypothetical protein ABM34_12675 [Companilactobacillus ginsenosidimutans]
MKIFNKVKSTTLSMTCFILLMLVLTNLSSTGRTSADNNSSNQNPTVFPYISSLSGLTRSTPSEADFNHALKTAPSGLAVDTLFTDNNYFENSQGTSIQGFDNSAELLKSTSLRTNNTSIARVTDAPKEIGAIWSNIDAGNYIDVNRNQVLSMWVYLGGYGITSGSVGDGMALVFQNDERENHAISSYSKMIGDKKTDVVGTGESLGVWGDDVNHFDKSIDSDSIAKTAIQKSFAVEFDTFGNHASQPNEISEDGNGSNFDNEYHNQHISMNYPDNASTYHEDYVGTKKVFVMDHPKDVTKDFSWSYLPHSLTNGKWHHVTITWLNADHDDKAKLIYEFNDKKNSNYVDYNPDPYVSGSTNIDISHFDMDGSNKLRWGFTSSTGDNSENNLAIFESIPPYVTGDVESNIYNQTKKKSINKNDAVDAGDDLKFNYSLIYEDGIKDWINNVAYIDLPKQVEYQSAKIIYANGHTESPEVTYDKDKSQLKLDIKEPLSLENNKATVEINSVASPVGKPTTVGNSVVKFKSTYLILDTETPQFIINPHEVGEGTVKFGNVNPTSSFQNINSVTKYGDLISRKNDWLIEVVDDRKNKQNINPWRVEASAVNNKPNTNSGLNIVYKDSDGNVKDLENTYPSTNIPIAKENQLGILTNIVDSWKKNSGVLLRSNASTIPGSYSWQITWTLKDSI